jgi:glycosyltransferase involved in cell wall biosynthesis
MTNRHSPQIGFVVIGRNEGSRLDESLRAIRNDSESVVYVDSGSTDGSPEAARQLGVEVIELSAQHLFSAARARNAGFEFLRDRAPTLEYVQFVDGDCVLDPGWPSIAIATFESGEDIVAVCGRRRERLPEASIYNRICDVEWRIPPLGEALVFGGDVAIRVDALTQAGGYDPSLISCEDEELALRLRAAGGKILQLEESSGCHDAAMFRVKQWLLRAVRWGHGIAQVSSMHAASSDGHYAQAKRRTLIYGGAVPLTAIVLVPPTSGISLALLLLFVLQFRRLVEQTLNIGIEKDARLWSMSCVMAQPANLVGMLLYHYRRRVGDELRIIDYKRR